MEEKFWNEMFDEEAHGDLREALRNEQVGRATVSQRRAGENRAARRDREKQERRNPKKQPA